MKEINAQLERRMITLAVGVVRMCEKNKQKMPFSIVDQVIRSSSSIGANFTEANDAVSKPDFRNKIAIAKKEAAETRYWLSIIEELDVQVDPVIKQETTELILILQKTINSLREKR